MTKKKKVKVKRRFDTPREQRWTDCSACWVRYCSPGFKDWSREQIRAYCEDCGKPKSSEPEHKVEVEPEVYDGKKQPKERKGKLGRIIVSGDKCPMKLDDAKFKTILEWGEYIRDVYEDDGKFITITALASWIRTMDHLSSARKEKAIRRLNAIYSVEYQRDLAFLEHWGRGNGRVEGSDPTEDQGDGEGTEGSGRQPIKPDPAFLHPRKDPRDVRNPGPRNGGNKVERDRFGVRTSSEAAKINAVITDKPKTTDQIRKEAGVHRNVSSHMNWMVTQGFAVKLKDGRYKLKEDR